MNCEAYQTQLPEYMDGTLPDDVSEVLEKHLRTCAKCAAVLAAERKGLESFAGLMNAGLGQRRPSSAMRSNLAGMGRLPVEADRVVIPDGWLAWARPLAAAALLILTFGFGIYWH